MNTYYDEERKVMVVYAGEASPKWVVTAVSANDDYTLELDFADGSKRLFDMRPYLEKPVFAPLRDLEYFKKAHAQGPTVAWDDKLDLAPEALYEKSAEPIFA